ncbi:hypothetical protein M422DRAFT_256418 [Sphaerobolus stellatus SS14]|uniref:Uncharacterized protein n=1 Tax=Sphaerobolus stellatus (strain SS14) TaxID=990650 RepID=A0A0C9VH25_SPHS4|nr:hypothetical protein M422DRAFT_256418 [Sphaerobolus stellatus SS14]
MEALEPQAEPAIAICNSSTLEIDGLFVEYEDSEDEDIEIEEAEYIQLRRTFDEDTTEAVSLLRYLADALESQREFRDPHFLTDFKHNISGSLRYAQKLQQYEHQVNSASAPNPRTWDNSTPMFFRARTAHSGSNN